MGTLKLLVIQFSKLPYKCKIYRKLNALVYIKYLRREYINIKEAENINLLWRYFKLITVSNTQRHIIAEGDSADERLVVVNEPVCGNK